ncbi:MAG: DUF885 domain-containing protein [Cytophagaceae bacterium]
MAYLNKIFPFILLIIIISCTGNNKVSEYSEEDVRAESQRLNDFFERLYNEYVDMHPETQSYLGIKKDYDKWDDNSEDHNERMFQRGLANYEAMKDSFNFDMLARQEQISYRLFEHNIQMQKEGRAFRFHNYPVNQLFGLHSSAPSFLINIHRVDSVADAKAYISRLEGMKPLFEQFIENIRVRENKGILPPKFVFERVIDDCRGVIKGEPFQKHGEHSNLLADFTGKVNKLDISQAERNSLIKEARTAMTAYVQPVYERLISYLIELEKKATSDDGVWKLPDGDKYYQYALKRNTTTDLTPEEVFETGKNEVERIKGEMHKIMDQVGFDGDLNAFYEYLRKDPKFYYPNTDKGRKAYLQRAEEILDSMKLRLNELFITLPKADLVVKPVESFREKSSPAAFYQSPAPDGSRPGIFYANTYDMSTMAKYEMEALAYHEGLPGHHMQIAIAQEIEGLPKFRRFGNYTAYAEGWGLYSELIPKEMGLYENPYSDFGRLTMEMWRACRLVIDVGLHHKKWSREEAIDYLCTNTPNNFTDCRREIDRYIVLPGQATAYKVGMIKILALRQKAQSELGDRFDMRRFHDALLTDGALPLNILEENIDEWIKNEKDRSEAVSVK